MDYKQLYKKHKKAVQYTICAVFIMIKRANMYLIFSVICAKNGVSIKRSINEHLRV